MGIPQVGIPQMGIPQMGITLLENGGLSECYTGTATRTMNQWAVCYCVEALTLHLNRDRSWDLLSSIVLIPVPFCRQIDTFEIFTPCVLLR